MSFSGGRDDSAYIVDKGVFYLPDEETVDDCERARQASDDEPEVVSRRVSFNRCGPHLEGGVSRCSIRRERARVDVHSRRGGVRNLAQERLCSVRPHSKGRLLVEETL